MHPKIARSPAPAAVPAREGLPMDRRGFLSLAAKGLTVAVALPLAGRSAEVAAAAPTTEQLADAYINIAPDNTITLFFGGAEMGQGSMTGLAQILAEELSVDWNQVQVVQSPVDPVVSYFTGGSSAVSGRYARLRNAGAAARELLVAAAMAQVSGSTRDSFVAQSAKVTHVPTGKAWTYGTLADAAALLKAPSDLRLTDPTAFRVIGKPVPRVDIPAKVDGSAKFGIDTWSKDMVFAAIRHCPVIGGTVASIGATPSGALAVVPCKATDTRGAVVKDSVNAVAVVAANTWLARRLANGLAVSWNLPASTAGVDSAAIVTQAQGLLATGAGRAADPASTDPTVLPAAYASAIRPLVLAALGSPTVDLTFQLPYLAHATLEPLACTVSITAAGCEIWAPTQAASSVAALAASLTGLAADKVNVHTTFLGGGLGRKFELDYVGQAIQVAKAVGKPVKLTWFREEDFAHDQYRPFALVNVRATLASGTVGAWLYRNVSQSILGQRGWVGPDAVDSQAVEGAVHLPYDLGTKLVEWVPLPAGIPVGFWRSVGSSINAFVVESTIDELARLSGTDPFVFRSTLLRNDPAGRAGAVLHAADVMSSAWRGSLPAGHKWGVAIAQSFGTVVAQVVEVSQPTSTSLTVHRVDCVIDCGTVINPDSVQAQMQGAIVHALSAALWGEMTFAAGKANQQNFSSYRSLRLSEMPKVNVQVVKSANPPSGVGEPGVPPLAPAIANAFARLTGKRVTKLPFFPGMRMGGL